MYCVMCFQLGPYPIGMDLPKILYVIKIFHPRSHQAMKPPVLSCLIKPSAFVKIMGNTVMNIFIRAMNLVMCQPYTTHFQLVWE